MATQNELLTAIENGIKEMVTLKITTAVGPVKLDGNTLAPDYTNAKIMYTEIDLVQGDIKTIYDEVFVTETYKHLAEFHQSREEQGQAIVKANIEAIEKMIELVARLSAPAPAVK